PPGDRTSTGSANKRTTGLFVNLRSSARPPRVGGRGGGAGERSRREGPSAPRPPGLAKRRGILAKRTGTSAPSPTPQPRIGTRQSHSVFRNTLRSHTGCLIASYRHPDRSAGTRPRGLVVCSRHTSEGGA